MLSCAQALKRLEPQAELIYIGEDNQLTRGLVEGSGLKSHYILAGKWRRYPADGPFRQIIDIKTHLLNLGDVAKLFAGFWQSLWKIWRLKPDVVFVKGGYVGLPVGLAAWVAGRRLVIHESDTVPGLTNRLLANLAATVATGWPAKYYPRWHKRHLVFTGNPIRSEILDGQNHPATLQLESGIPLLLVVGGSRGARALNQAITNHLATLTNKLQVVHISGSADYQRLKPSASKIGKRYHLYPWLEAQDLVSAYKAATIIVSRAGMNTLAEIAAIAKPLIVVPHPNTPGDHQIRNAQVLEREQAAILLYQEQLEERLVPTVNELLAAVEHQKLLVKGLRRLAKPEAAELLAKAILELV